MSFPMEADLPAGLACLKSVDTLLRCPICFDFLNISMMTKCSHNFCSLCIRKFLSYKLQCPVCNTQMTESDLRNNRLLDDLVVNFQAARQQLSKVNFDSPPISPKTPATAVKCKTPRKRDQKCNGSVLSQFFLKKSETASKRKSQRDGYAAQWEKILAAPTRCEKDADLHSGRAPLSAAVKEEPMSVETSCLSQTMSVKQETSLFDISSELQNAHSSVDVKPVIKVECPVCSVYVSPHFINKHLDTCLTRGEKKESLRSSFGKTRHPMGKLVYNLLSVQELKRRLKECHLSMQGARDQLIRRHQEFVHLYNAQCDALNPKSAEDIAKEVEANEKIRNQLHGKSKPVMVFSKNQSEKEIEEMHSNYRKQHRSDFSRLIAQVRGRLETSKHTHVKQEVSVEEEEAHKAPSADEVAAAKSLVKIKEEDEDEEQQTVMLSSPGDSDVSISSSLSDIFGPELHINLQDTKTSGCRGDDAVSPSAPGKRRRKS